MLSSRKVTSIYEGEAMAVSAAEGYYRRGRRSRDDEEEEKP